MLPNETIKIVLAFDEQLVADGLDAILSGERNFSIVGKIKNNENLFSIIPKLNPNLIVFEFLVWLAKYTDLMSKLNSSFPNLKILIISELISQDLMNDVMPLINGYVFRSCSSEKVILAVQEIIESGKYLCPRAIDEYFNCSHSVKSDSILTMREKEVLCTWIESIGNKEIAENLNISTSTVRTHLNNIRQKLGNLNHLQLMIYACRQNIMNKKFKPICPNCRSFCN